jgi:hypothetical protein
MHLAHVLAVCVSAGFWVSVRSASRVLGPADPSSHMAGGEACVLTQELPSVCVNSCGAGWIVLTSPCRFLCQVQRRVSKRCPSSCSLRGEGWLVVGRCSGVQGMGVVWMASMVGV